MGNGCGFVSMFKIIGFLLTVVKYGIKLFSWNL